jgi:hypothetical protein
MEAVGGMAWMGDPGDVVEGLDLAEAAGLQARALGGRVRADRRDLERDRVRDLGRVDRVLCRTPVGLRSVRRLDRGYRNSEVRLGRQRVRRLDPGPVACWAFRRARPPRERRQEGMSALSRLVEGVGFGHHLRAFPAPDRARGCRGHDRADHPPDRFRGENPPLEDRDSARCPA